MKIAVIGSRKFPDLSRVEEFVNHLPEDTTVISGGATGVDETAYQAADSRGLSTIVLFPSWDRYGKKAGFIRNVDIVVESDEVVAFWDGKSKGTKITIDLATKMNKPLTIFTPDTVKEK